MRGFYAGALPNMTRCLMKNTYRYPLLVGLPSFFKEHSPEFVRQRKVLLKLLTGTSVAFVEAVITCPIERLKVYFMTDNDKISYRQFFKMN